MRQRNSFICRDYFHLRISLNICSLVIFILKLFFTNHLSFLLSIYFWNNFFWEILCFFHRFLHNYWFHHWSIRQLIFPLNRFFGKFPNFQSIYYCWVLFLLTMDLFNPIRSLIYILFIGQRNFLDNHYFQR